MPSDAPGHALSAGVRFHGPTPNGYQGKNGRYQADLNAKTPFRAFLWVIGHMEQKKGRGGPRIANPGCCDLGYCSAVPFETSTSRGAAMHDTVGSTVPKSEWVSVTGCV